jgi:hypothetical protein
MTSVGHWVLNASTGSLQLVGSQHVGSINVSLLPAAVKQLFPPNLLYPNANTEEILYRIYSQELETDVWKAKEKFTEDIPHQCRVMTLHETKFDLSEKTRRTEHQRTTYRVDTRMYQSQPELKSVVNFLCPTMGAANIHLQKSLNVKHIDPADEKEIERLNVLYDAYHKTPYGFCFRGSLPVSIMKSDIPEIYNNRQFWTVAPKTNGLRFFLIACTFYNQHMVILMDRSLKLYLLPLSVPLIWFQGTILDGELVSVENGGYAFIIYDCWQCNGVPVAQESYLNRLQIASLAIESIKQKEQAKPSTLFLSPCNIELRVKPVYTIDQAPAMLMNELNQMDHLLDGLILTAVEPSAPIGRALNKIYKYKVGPDNTIECLIQYVPSEKEPFRMDLLCSSSATSKTNEYVLWASVSDFRISQGHDLNACCKQLGILKCETWETLAASIHGAVLECEYVLQADTWKMKCVREKAEPNLLTTAEKTFQNIKEGLRLTDIFPKHCSWTEEQRLMIQKWEEGFQKTLGCNWTAVPQLKMGKQKDYVPIRALAPVSLKEMRKLVSA